MKSYAKFKSDNLQYLSCENASSAGVLSNAVMENGILTVDITGIKAGAKITGIKKNLRILDATFIPLSNAASTNEFQVYSVGSVSASHLAVDFDSSFAVNKIITPDKIYPTNCVVSGGEICISGNSASLQGKLIMRVQPA